MNKFHALVTFTAVAESGGFTAAGRKLGLSTSAVTKIVARLEDDLVIQLFNRSTRRLVLTDYGQEFYERSVRILAELEDAEAMVREANATPRGTVRPVVPFSFGRVTLVPALTQFSERYRDIRLNLTFLDEPVDLIAEGFDVGVRTGVLSDSRIIARVLTRGQQVTFAAPSYLARYGEPSTPEELHAHACIVGRFGPEWTFQADGGGEVTIRVDPRHVIWSGDALREAIVAGLGRVQVFGTKGWLEMQDDVTLVARDNAGVTRTVVLNRLDKERAALEAFARAIRGEAAYPAGDADIVNGVAVMEAMVTSAAHGRPVEIPGA